MEFSNNQKILEILSSIADEKIIPENFNKKNY